MRKIYFLLLCLLLISSGCTKRQEQNNAPAVFSDKAYIGKKILFIESYHVGYSWSDGITRGVQETLSDKGITLKIHRMDTKRNTSDEFRKQAAVEARELIGKIKPDVLLVSDDNAFNYLVKEYYRNAELPIVYCGLNWDSSVYGAPYKNTAGMIEISLTEQAIKTLRQYSAGSRTGYISGDTTTERKVMENYKKMGIKFDKEYWPASIDEFKRDFLALQEETDMILLENVIGLKGWNEELAAELKTFIEENIKVPVAGLYDWTRDYALLQIEKSSFEQGEYMARTALRILKGEKPSDIPEVSNKKGDLVLNLRLADKLGIAFSPTLLKNADIIVGE